MAEKAIEEKEVVVKEKEKEKEKVGVKEKETLINAVYRVNLHCRESAREIRRPLLRTRGVHGVEVSLEKNEVKVKGEIDPLKIHKRRERLFRRKVEMISPKIQVKETENKVVKEVKKELPVRTIHLRAYMHCDQCEQDLRRKLISHKAIFGVKTDYKAQTLTVQGTIGPNKLLAYVRRKVNKQAEIIKQVTEKEKVVEKGRRLLRRSRWSRPKPLRLSRSRPKKGTLTSAAKIPTLVLLCNPQNLSSYLSSHRYTIPHICSFSMLILNGTYQGS